MRKQVILIVITFVFALALSGTVATENTTTRGENGSLLIQDHNLSQLWRCFSASKTQEVVLR
jgi:hypothetical protein